VTFAAQPAPDDGDYAFAFAASQADYNVGYVLDTGSVSDGDELDVDLDWVAAKFDRLATYWWGVCPVGLDLAIVVAGCSPPRTFSLRFRTGRPHRSAGAR
jgi:hypothetical protein